MPTLLEDSTDQARGDHQVTVRVVADGGRRRRPLFGSIVSTVVVGALAVGVLVIAGVLTGVLDLANPFATSTVDRSSPALLKELNNLSSYSAAQGRFQQTIDVEDDVSILPSFIAGERTTFVANGTVDATIDFATLSTAAVQSRGDGAVTITLPEPRLNRAVIEMDNRYRLLRDKGVRKEFFKEYKEIEMLYEIISPDAFLWTTSGEALLMVIIGGTGTLGGSMLGAAAFILLQSMVSSYTERWMLILGLTFVLLVLFAPGGILGALRGRVGIRS
jgi:hypothetical protein